MASLGFDLLDAHVVAGRGDDIASSDATGMVTYAQLLERSAALGGGLRALGVQEGDAVAVAVEPGNLQVTIVCACVRIGAVPGHEGVVRIADDGEQARTDVGEEAHDLTLIQKAGATDPASSLRFDARGYRDAVRGGFAGVVDELLAGGTVSP
jgi:hypothetical protein